jgi:hypothetical protein
MTSIEDYLHLDELVGDNCFRGYLCLSLSGEPVSAQIILSVKMGYQLLGRQALTEII